MRKHFGYGVHAFFWRDLVETLLDLAVGVQCFGFDLLRVAHELGR